MKPLKPGHHPVGVVPNQARIDSVRVQNRLRHMRFDLIGKRSYDRVELGLILLHLLSIGVRRGRALLKSVSVTRQLHLPTSGMARPLPD
jgi:hypothetical protein